MGNQHEHIVCGNLGMINEKTFQQAAFLPGIQDHPMHFVYNMQCPPTSLVYGSMSHGAVLVIVPTSNVGETYSGYAVIWELVNEH